MGDPTTYFGFNRPDEGDTDWADEVNSNWASIDANLGFHAARHQSGGADAIKLDDLAAPDDNTDLDVSTSAHGLAPKAPNDTSKFLRGDGTWAVAAGGTAPTVQVLTASSGTYTLPAGCSAIRVRMWGAGGGGGGVNSNSSLHSIAGAGGAAGGYTEKLVTSPDSSYSYACGAGGTGGTTGSPCTGSTGGDTTFGSSFLTAYGGGGGSGNYRNNGVPALGGYGTTGSGGDVNNAGSPGMPGIPASGAGVSGGGGSSLVGAGGNWRTTNGAGNDGEGFGSGGGGARAILTQDDAVGGDGGPGLIIVEEYY